MMRGKPWKPSTRPNPPTLTLTLTLTVVLTVVLTLTLNARYAVMEALDRVGLGRGKKPNAMKVTVAGS